MIFLKILAVLGIILLVILGLIIIVLLYLLFAPIAYDIRGRWDGSRDVRFRIHDLLHIVSGKVIYHMDSGLKVSVRLFGFKELMNDTEDETKAGEPEETENKSFEDPGSQKLMQPQQFVEKADSGEVVSEVLPDEESGDTELHSPDEDAVSIRVTDHPKGSKKESSSPGIRDMLTRQNLDAVRFILRNLLGFIKRILPHIKRIRGEYSLGAPDLTGQSLGLFSCFPFMYRRGNSLRADFESENIYFDGELEAKGRIRLSWLAGALLRIWFNKNARELVLKVIGG